MRRRAIPLLMTKAAALLAAVAAAAGDLDGRVVHDVFGGIDDANAVAIQGNGRIVVGGATTGCGDIDFARYHAITD